MLLLEYFEVNLGSIYQVETSGIASFTATGHIGASLFSGIARNIRGITRNTIFRNRNVDAIKCVGALRGAASYYGYSQDG